MIQLMVRKPLGELNNLPDKKADAKKKEEEKVEVKEEKVKVAEVGESKVYKVGDGLDVRDRETGESIRLYEKMLSWPWCQSPQCHIYYPKRCMV